jgi:heme exporter protein C
MGLLNNEEELGIKLDTRTTLVNHIVYGIALVMILVSSYLIFIYSNIEKQMGPVQKIFYVHVGTAWNALLAFGVVFVCSILFLATKKRIYDVYATVAAEIGVIFICIVMLTGPIWARSAWNVWWSWEPKLTSALILFFIYIAYTMIRFMDGSWDKKARLCAVFGIIGFIDVPIVYFASDWWGTKFHPNVVSNSGGLEGNMVFALVFTVFAFSFFLVALIHKGVRVEKARIELQHMKDKIADRFNK